MKHQLLTSIAGIVLVLTSGNLAKADPMIASVNIGPQSPASISPGAAAIYNISVTRSNSGAMDVYMTCSNLPLGASASFSPAMMVFGSSTPSNSSTLTISTTASIPSGVYNFTVTAQDGGSHNIRTNTGTLTIGTDGKTVVSSQTITSVTMLPNQTAQLALQAAAGKSYLLQATASLNPSSWTTIATNTTDATGLCLFIDANAANYSSRFYRTAAAN